MKFQDNFLLYTIIPLLVLFAGASYYRFMVIHDYTVAYEGTCDEYTESCFIGCEDEECTSEYYYTKIQKYAPTLYEQCGVDITDCENANTCLDNEETCSITFCNSELDVDECELLTEDDFIEPIDTENTSEGDSEGEATLDDTLEI